MDITIKNFKGIRSFSYKNLSPITILSGANSGGKTSLIQSILMIKQSIEFGSSEIPIVLNGHYTQLGLFSKLIHKGQKFIEIELKDSIEPSQILTKDPRDGGDYYYRRNLLPHINNNLNYATNIMDIYFRNKENPKSVLEELDSMRFSSIRSVSSKGKRPRRIFKDMTYSLKIGTKSNSENPYIKELLISVSEIVDTSVYEHTLQLSNTRLDSYKISTNSPIFFDLRNILWSSNYNDIHHICEFLKDKVERPTDEVHNYNSANITFSGLNLSLVKDEKKKDEFIDSSFINHLINLITLNFNDVEFIGPLRDEPRSLYLKETDLINDIGIKGENAGLIFAKNFHKIVSCPILNEEKNKIIKKEMTLEEAVNYWLNDKFKLAKKIAVNQYKDNNIYEIEVTNFNNIKTPISSVGFGVSQIFPIIVSSLISADNAMLIFEQPEIHLHPRVQSLLFDFVYGIQCVSKTKRIIIETHSDHLINKYRIYKIKNSDNVPNPVTLFFADSENSTLHPIEFDEYGNLTDWPQGFFDQSAIDNKTIFQKQLQKKMNNPNSLIMEDNL
ncbi:DUF3696 domain-containing protein [Enterococcus casseliflavus]|nr:DUF3696 domain-containing protein [Enterococcus casseliflavus]